MNRYTSTSSEKSLGNNLKKTLPSRHAQHADSAQNQANRMLRMAAQKVLHSLRDFQDDVLDLVSSLLTA
jgi:vacuolar-type H+-ATPase subunit E/Vma4